MAAKKTTTKVKAKPKAKPKAKAAPARKATAVKDPMTKTQILTEIAENTELSKKEVQAVLDELANVMERHVKKRAVGQFTLPGLMKVQVVRKPATKARKGINPFNGEETIFKAKPARNVVKIRPLKKLKDMVV
ncbi:MAG: HU family DNA-binding protein [Gammaproteobacteria bacterium]|nr:HU family DNA-binding protein [Gammaproteobacteria bacterium]